MVVSPNGALPLVGCSCGAEIGRKYVNTKSSMCNVCKRFQCLVCGDEFKSSQAIGLHLGKTPNHTLNDASVYSKYTNCPTNVFQMLTPTHDDKIALHPCDNPCIGKASDSFKVNQYTSKCKLCDSYKCLVCGYSCKRAPDMRKHIQSETLHWTGKLDCLADPDPKAIEQNNFIVAKSCMSCDKTGVALRDKKDTYSCKFCGESVF